MRRLIWVLLLLPQVVFAQATLSPEVREHLQAGLQAEEGRAEKRASRCDDESAA